MYLLIALSSNAPASATLRFFLFSGSSVIMATVALSGPPSAMLPCLDLPGIREPRLEPPGIRDPLLESDLRPSSPLFTEKERTIATFEVDKVIFVLLNILHKLLKAFFVWQHY